MSKNVAEMIRELRRGLELTQEQFAAGIGVTFSAADRWDDGKTAPSPLVATRTEELLRATGTD